MKVIQINSNCGIGSTGRIALAIQDLLLKKKHYSKIAYGRNSSEKGENIYKIGTKLDNYIHFIYSRIFDMHGLLSVGPTKRLINFIEKYNPDIIHLHNIHGYYINYPILFNFLKDFNKPVVWTLHDCWSFTGHCAHFEGINCNKWKTKCYSCPQLNNYPKSIFDNCENNFTNKKKYFSSLRDLTIVTPSNWLMSKVKESFLNMNSVTVINNGIDLDKFKPSNGKFRSMYNLHNNIILLGVANTWTQNKGLDDFIQLSKMLNSNERIVLVGVDQKIKKQLPKNIIGIARTSSQYELAEIYSDSDIFINPTYEDTFPTTNIEAISCGTPVITYNTGGSVEIVNERVGRIVDKGDLNSLKNEINNILKEKARFRINCLNDSKKYSQEDRFEEYIELYNKIVMGKN